MPQKFLTAVDHCHMPSIIYGNGAVICSSKYNPQITLISTKDFWNVPTDGNKLPYETEREVAK